MRLLPIVFIFFSFQLFFSCSTTRSLEENQQLYTGAQRIICTASHNKPAPTLIQDTLMKLSVLPARVEELKKSAA